MKERLYKTLKPIFLILLLGIVYVVLIYTTDFRIPCPFRYVTGLDCPGCGVSRVILSYLKLDFKTAFYTNPVITVILPILFVDFIYHKYHYVVHDNKKDFNKLENIVLYIMIGALILYAVIKNIYVHII
ncbi:MAG: DUF2752 domain-containing protein [Ruminococcus sp.]|nr:MULTISPECIES: DUF2752 domain-containing protein [Ruminococcus]MCI5598739.1 DUF2752 domain-containing protein [Ruminococcus sp.]MCI5618186.1 DUF2752 domain-containing protein [Ruminococcus sp.]MCI6505054.1 DUF2752 domain-containing protein [Ruminococcus sp.]MDD6531305.1 DUF2752 domain-containing protein [Ruminococcus sp.]MDD6708845.1 DUF2752 domain-containing protein [Ruminococcus sp.]